MTSTGGAVDSFKVTSGTLPAGLTITKASGLINGTPTTAASALVITVTGYNAGGTGTGMITIVVAGPVTSSGGSRKFDLGFGFNF